MSSGAGLVAASRSRVLRFHSSCSFASSRTRASRASSSVRPVQRLEPGRQLAQLGLHQVDTRAAHHLLPLAGDALPPALGQRRVDRLLEHERRHAELARPRLGDQAVPLAPRLRHVEGDRRQASPRRLLGVGLERRAEGDRAVLVDVVGVAALGEQAEVARRALLRGADRRPPLVDDVRQAHGAEELVRRVGVGEHERLAARGALADAREPLALVAERLDRRLEPLDAAGAHAATAAKSSARASPESR